jgi:hypothetical protein
MVSVQKLCWKSQESLFTQSRKIGPERFRVGSFVQRLVFNNLTTLLIPKGEHYLLFRRIKGQTEVFHSEGQFHSKGPT